MIRTILALTLLACAALAALALVRPELALTGWLLVPVLLLAAIVLQIARRLP